MTCRETKSRTATAASAIACRLEGDDYRHRLASISELARAALLDHRRDNRSLHLAYAPEAAARVRRMVEEERVCCPFLVVELEETASAVFVGITPSRLDLAMLDILFDHFTDVLWALPAALPRCAKVRFRREASTATQVGNDWSSCAKTRHFNLRVESPSRFSSIGEQIALAIAIGRRQ